MVNVAQDVRTSKGTTLPGSALFSPCGNYRYLLTRRLRDSQSSEQEKITTFIMLNPSTADATRNDPTIRKCIGFAQRWQCDLLQVLNLFAVRATLPTEMKRAAAPIGPDNLECFARTLIPTAENHLVICAWGVHGAHLQQGQHTLQWLRDQGIQPLALGLTRDGHPRHPLYVAYTTTLISYSI